MTALKRWRDTLRQPWVLAVLLACGIPLFPEFCCPFMAAGSLVAAYVDGKRRGRRLVVGPLGKLVMLYTLYITLGLIYSHDRLSTLSTSAMWLVLLTLYVALTSVLTDKHRLRSALFFISIVAGLAGAAAWMACFLHTVCHLPVSLEFWSWLERPVLDLLPIQLLPLDPDAVYRASSMFTNPNIFAEYCAMALPFVAYSAFSGPRNRRQLVCRVCLLSAAVGGVFSFSRAFFVVLLVLAVLYCIAYIRKSWMILIGLASGALLVPANVTQRLLSVSSSDASVNERFAIWETGLRAFGSTPLFGIGAGVDNTWALLLSHGINAPHMHNLPLQLLVEGGVVALFLVLLMGWRLLRHALDLLGKSRSLGVAWIAFLAAFCSISLVEFPFLTPKLVAHFLMILALADSSVRVWLDYPCTPLSRYADAVYGGLNRLRGRKAR